MDKIKKMGTVKKQIAALFPKRKPGSHKGDYGHLLIVGGSRNLTGSVILAGKAALRSGVGLLTLGIPASLKTVVACAIPEAMTLSLPEDRCQAIGEDAEESIIRFINARGITALALGIGLTTNPAARTWVKNIIPRIPVPCVIDADGLNCLEGEMLMLAKAKVPCVITPHPKEMARLIASKTVKVQKERAAIARAVAKKTRCIVVLKGHGTVVTDGARIFVNPTGNPGMATGGTGDVLTGTIGSFLAQGFSAFDAARAGVFIHGLAGDIIKKKKTEISLIASDLIETLPFAFKQAGIK
jgi:NAD(P)H-hydrate epimerase